MAYYAFDTKDDLINIQNKFNDKYACYNHITRMYMCNSLTLSKEDVKNKITNGDPYVIRFKVEPNIDINFHDIIRGDITINSNQLDDKVLIKSDGIPTYHFANIVDDYDMRVTHVIRGDEWLPSTPLHVLLYKAFDWDMPKFAHLPLILSPDGKGKLSKRNAAKYGFSVFPLSCDAWDDDLKKIVHFKGWKESGYDALPFMNFLALLGWAPGNDIEKMSMDDMIKLFDLNNINHTGARFDHIKAKSFNSDYLKNNIPNTCLLKWIDTNGYNYPNHKLDMIVDICKNRSDFKYELNNVAKIFFSDLTCDDKSKYDDNYKLVMSDFISKNIDYNDTNIIKNTIFDICNSKGVKMGKIMPGLRNAIAGGIPGPDLVTTMSILDSNVCKDRIKKTL